MSSNRSSQPGFQNIATPQVVDAAHYAKADTLIGTGIGLAIGNMVGATVGINAVSGPSGTTPADLWTDRKSVV